MLEYSVKGPLFGCRMCGNCLLQETALICPMECPKGLRNGPCGGSTSEACYVDPSRPCIWFYERSFEWGREDLLLEVLPPLDWEQVGKNSWSAIFEIVGKLGVKKTLPDYYRKKLVHKHRDGIFRPVRQPEWWQGDSKYHAPAYTETAFRLTTEAGRWRICSYLREITPPLSSTTDKLIRNIDMVKHLVTAVNFTDNQSAVPRMSSWACSQTAINQGAEPVLELSHAESLTWKCAK